MQGMPSQQTLQRAASKSSHRLGGEDRTSRPDSCFFNLGSFMIIAVQAGGHGYASLISISDWISLSPSGYMIQRKLYVMMWKNLVQYCNPSTPTPPWCSMSLQLSLSAVYHLSLTLICPAWIVRRSERAPYFTHNYLISQPLAQDQNRGEARRVPKAGAPITWWCVYVCVGALCCVEAVG